MILQIGLPSSPINNVFEGIRRIFNPQGVARDALKREVVKNPAQGLRIADSIRTTRASFETPDVAAQIGDARKSFDADPFSPTAATLGLDVNSPENRELLTAIEAAFPATLAGQEEVLQTLEGGARRNVDADIAADKASPEVSRATELRAVNAQRQEIEGGRIDLPEALAQRQLTAAQQATELADLSIAFNTKDLDLLIEAQDNYNEWVDAHPEFKGIAGIALRNPVLLGHLEFIEDLSLREKALLLRTQLQREENRFKTLGTVLGVFKDLQQLRLSTLEITEGSANIREGKAPASAKRGALQLDRDVQNMLEEAGFSPGVFAPQLAEEQRTGFLGQDIETAVTVISPPRGTRGKGQGEVTGESEARVRGTQEIFIEAGREALTQIARADGMDEVVNILFVNPTDNIRALVETLRSRGELQEFMDTLTRNSKEVLDLQHQEMLEVIGNFGTTKRAGQ